VGGSKVLGGIKLKIRYFLTNTSKAGSQIEVKEVELNL
jgi:hypothetical protein